MEARRQSSMMWSIFLLNGTETSISNASSCGGVLRCVRYVILKPKTLTHVLVVERTLIDDGMANKHRDGLLCCPSLSLAGA
jgi:hypothetical protein